MTPITSDRIESYTNKLLQEYEWTEETAPDWDIDCPYDEESIYFGVELIGENNIHYTISAYIVYRGGIVDEHIYEVSVDSKCVEKSDTCFMEELEAVVNKYITIVGMKKNLGEPLLC